MFAAWSCCGWEMLSWWANRFLAAHLSMPQRLWQWSTAPVLTNELPCMLKVLFFFFLIWEVVNINPKDGIVGSSMRISGRFWSWRFSSQAKCLGRLTMMPSDKVRLCGSTETAVSVVYPGCPCVICFNAWKIPGGGAGGSYKGKGCLDGCDHCTNMQLENIFKAAY